MKKTYLKLMLQTACVVSSLHTASAYACDCEGIHERYEGTRSPREGLSAPVFAASRGGCLTLVNQPFAVASTVAQLGKSMVQTMGEDPYLPLRGVRERLGINIINGFYQPVVISALKQQINAVCPSADHAMVLGKNEFVAAGLAIVDTIIQTPIEQMYVDKVNKGIGVPKAWPQKLRYYYTGAPALFCDNFLGWSCFFNGVWIQKKFINPYFEPHVHLAVSMVLDGVLAGTLEAAATFPFTTIRTLMQGNTENTPPGELMRSHFKLHGLRGFYRGVGPKWVQLMLAAAVDAQFFAENAKDEHPPLA